MLASALTLVLSCVSSSPASVSLSRFPLRIKKPVVSETDASRRGFPGPTSGSPTRKRRIRLEHVLPITRPVRGYLTSPDHRDLQLLIFIC